MAATIDTVNKVLDSHIKRLQEISNESFQSAKGICDDTAATIRKQSGLRSVALDKALEALGIVTAGETNT